MTNVFEYMEQNKEEFVKNFHSFDDNQVGYFCDFIQKFIDNAKEFPQEDILKIFDVFILLYQTCDDDNYEFDIIDEFIEEALNHFKLNYTNYPNDYTRSFEGHVISSLKNDCNKVYYPVKWRKESANINGFDAAAVTYLKKGYVLKLVKVTNFHHTWKAVENTCNFDDNDIVIDPENRDQYKVLCDWHFNDNEFKFIYGAIPDNILRFKTSKNIHKSQCIIHKDDSIKSCTEDKNEDHPNFGFWVSPEGVVHDVTSFQGHNDLAVTEYKKYKRIDYVTPKYTLIINGWAAISYADDFNSSHIPTDVDGRLMVLMNAMSKETIRAVRGIISKQKPFGVIIENSDNEYNIFDNYKTANSYLTKMLHTIN